MIALDTNLLLRLLVQDDEEQCAKAENLLKERCTRHDPALVMLMNLCEAVWVLRDVYCYSKAEICGVLEVLLNMEKLVIEAGDVALRALEDYQRGQADFADYLVLRQSMALGADRFYTFDRKLAKHPLADLP